MRQAPEVSLTGMVHFPLLTTFDYTLASKCQQLFSFTAVSQSLPWSWCFLQVHQFLLCASLQFPVFVFIFLAWFLDFALGLLIFIPSMCFFCFISWTVCIDCFCLTISLLDQLGPGPEQACVFFELNKRSYLCFTWLPPCLSTFGSLHVDSLALAQRQTSQILNNQMFSTLGENVHSDPSGRVKQLNENKYK